MDFGIVLPALWTIAGPVAGFVAKFLWDRYWRKQDEIELIRLNRRIDLIAQQLSEFFWPLYLRLQKDNAVWEKILERSNRQDLVRQRVGTEIEKSFILPNHDEIVKIIESKIHLARADQELIDKLLTYIRHIAVYKAMRTAGIWEQDPIALGEPFPTQLFPLIEARVMALQAEYDRLLDRETPTLELARPKG